MGFVEIASIRNAEEAACMWKEFIDFSRQETEEFYEATCRIEDGSRFFVGKNQAVVIFSGERFVDYAVGAGAFIYHESFACGNYTKKTRRHSQMLRGADPDAFADFIAPGETVSCICLNMGKTVRIPFTFDEALYHDNFYGIDLILLGRGFLEAGRADPILQYAFAGFDKSRSMKQTEQTAFAISEEEQGVLAKEFEDAFEKTLIQMRDADMKYSDIPYQTEEILERICAELDKKWDLKRNISARYMEFAEIYPSEESLRKMIEIRRGRANI